ncbi:MAG: glycosyltransferase family 2 protein [Methanobacteriaceae archaeon]|nr:glycosyltransferase family 2 protein [Methanobacteriaceae archaeon]
MVETYIITPNYNGEKFLEKYFDSLFNQTYSNFRIIFVDNSPNNNSIDYINQNYYNEVKSDKIKIIKNPENYGFAKANNQGINESFKDSKCKFIVCLNNDTEIKEDFLEKLISMAEKRPKTGSIQPKMIWGQNPDLLDSVGLEYSKNGLGFNRGAYKSSDEYNEEEEILGCCAGACLYRREALEDVKLEGEYFDEDFFAYYEDFDLALRLRWASWSAWYCPDAVVWHYKGGTNEPTSDFTVYYNWRNYTWTLWKNMPLSFLIKNSYLIIICEILQITLNISRGKSTIIKSKIDAYKNLRKIIKKNKSIKKKISFENLEKCFILKWKV